MFALDGPTKLQQLFAEGPMEIGDHIVIGILLAYTFFCCILSLIKLNRHQKNVEQILASGGGKNLIWFKYFLVCVIIAAVIWIFFMVLQSTFLNYLVTSVHFIVVFFLAYYALHQEEVYNFNIKEKAEIQDFIENAVNHSAPKKLQLEPERLKELTQQLTRIMEEEKPFLDNDLNLLKLAGMLQINIHTLSYLINEGFNENFAQFVNRYRVEEAKKLLIDPDSIHLNMVGIAFDSGFNSKTAFNTTFKKITGLSPSEFKSHSSVL
jgi:AraC-like DNA-binding protein